MTATAALAGASEGKETVVFETKDVLALLRGAKIANEMKLSALRRRGRRVPAARPGRRGAAGPRSARRLPAGRTSSTTTRSGWTSLSLVSGRSTVRRRTRSGCGMPGLAFSFTTDGLEDPEEFGRRVREAMARGLSREDALAAVTTIPARQLGLADRLGTTRGRQDREPRGGDGRAVRRGDARHGDLDRRQAVRGSGEEARGARRRTAVTPAASPRGEGVAPDVRAFPARDDGAARRADRGRRARRDRLDAGPAGNSRERGRRRGPAARSRRSERASRRRPERCRGRRPRQARDAGHHRRHSHTAIDGSQRGREQRDRRGPDRGRPRSLRRRRSTAQLAGGTTTAQRPPRLGQRDRRPERDRQVRGAAAVRTSSSSPARRRGSSSRSARTRSSRTWQRIQRAALPADPHGRASLIRERFLAARDYRRRQDEYRKAAAVKGARRVPPQPDLQLEAIAEILEGKRQVHCHSYRQDEILEMIRVGRGVRRQDRDLPARARGLQGRRRDREARRRAPRASPTGGPTRSRSTTRSRTRRAHARARRPGVVQLRLGRARAPPEPRGREGRQVRRRRAGRRARVRHVEPGEAARDRRAASGSLEAGKDADFVVWSGDPLSTLDGRARDVDRGEEVLRPRRGPRAPAGAREGARRAGREGEEDGRPRQAVGGEKTDGARTAAAGRALEEPGASPTRAGRRLPRRRRFRRRGDGREKASLLVAAASRFRGDDRDRRGDDPPGLGPRDPRTARCRCATGRSPPSARRSRFRRARRSYDATGRHVYPSLLPPLTDLGLDRDRRGSRDGRHRSRWASQSAGARRLRDELRLGAAPGRRAPAGVLVSRRDADGRHRLRDRPVHEARRLDARGRDADPGRRPTSR